jgi:hypothetical protein
MTFTSIKPGSCLASRGIAMNQTGHPNTPYRMRAIPYSTPPPHLDPAIGALVAEAMEKVGDTGVITVEESKTIETTLEVVEGLQFRRGYISPYFITDQNTAQATLEEPHVLTCDRKLNILKDILPVLEQALWRMRCRSPGYRC